MCGVLRWLSLHKLLRSITFFYLRDFHFLDHLSCTCTILGERFVVTSGSRLRLPPDNTLRNLLFSSRSWWVLMKSTKSSEGRKGTFLIVFSFSLKFVFLYCTVIGSRSSLSLKSRSGSADRKQTFLLHYWSLWRSSAVVSIRCLASWWSSTTLAVFLGIKILHQLPSYFTFVIVRRPPDVYVKSIYLWAGGARLKFLCLLMKLCSMSMDRRSQLLLLTNLKHARGWRFCEGSGEKEWLVAWTRVD